MPESARVISGSLTKGSIAIPVGLNSHLVDYSIYRQGVEIRNTNDLTSGLRKKIRSNSSIERTLNGRSLDPNLFDDTLTTVTLKDVISGSFTTIPSPAVYGRWGEKISHVREQRDLGQTDLYDDGHIFFEATNPDDPVELISILDWGRELPTALVDHSSFSAMDGKIDPLNLIKSIDRSLIDHPYPARGVKGSGLAGQDPFLRSFVIEDKFMIPGKTQPVEYYEDTPENFGNVLIPGIFNHNVCKIEPFIDTSGDVERYVNKNITDGAMTGTLKGHSFFVDNRLENFDKMATGGFDYDQGPDSIVFGGLKK